MTKNSRNYVWKWRSAILDKRIHNGSESSTYTILSFKWKYLARFKRIHNTTWTPNSLNGQLYSRILVAYLSSYYEKAINALYKLA